MKINNHISRNALILTTTCLLLLNAHGTSQAKGSNAASPRVTVTRSASVESARDDARLIVTRIPNLGNHVIVDMYVDGVAVRPILYGQTYEALLSPGRHVLSVSTTPNPR